MNTNEDQKKRINRIALILAALVGFCGCFWFGRTSAEQEYRKEKELDYTLARSDLEMFRFVEGPIYVTGHKKPDSDTVCSAIAYADLMRAFGFDATPVVLGELSKETMFILEKAGVPAPEYLEDAAGKNMILVDHSETLHSADGLSDANVISIIDHHSVGDVTTNSPTVYDARPIGSAATIIWLRYRSYGIEPDQKTATLLLGAVLSDTSNLKTEATTAADREAIKILSGMAGIANIDEFYQGMTMAKYDYSGMSDAEIYLCDSKEYAAGNMKYSIGCLNAYDEEAARTLSRQMKEAMPQITKDTGVDMTFAQISIFHDDISITYVVPGNETAEELLRAASSAEIDNAEFDGTAFIFRPGFSRKKLVAMFTDQLEAYPKE